MKLLQWLRRRPPETGPRWVCGNGHVVARAQRAGFFSEAANTVGVGIIGILHEGAFLGDAQNPPRWTYYACPVRERCTECGQRFKSEDAPGFAVNQNKWSVLG
jgi:hypothetical protein